MRALPRPWADRIVDALLVTLAGVGWLVLAPATAVGTELWCLGEQLRAEWRELVPWRPR